METEVDNGSDHQTIGFQVSSFHSSVVSVAPMKGWDTSGGVNQDLFLTELIIAEWTIPNINDCPH